MDGKEQELLSLYKIARGSFTEELIFENPGGAVSVLNQIVFFYAEAT